MTTPFTTLRLSLKPVTAFGTPLLGETLFGQLCWVIKNTFGEERLMALLEGYTTGHPFVVLSDAFPKGFLPLPALPDNLWDASNDQDRKYLKKKAWLPDFALSTKPSGWRKLARTNGEVLSQATPLSEEEMKKEPPYAKTEAVIHNTIDRLTGTTGTNEFAPYVRLQTWFNSKLLLSVYAVLDESRLSRKEFIECFRTIGLCGFGRDASSGQGKFELDEHVEEVSLRTPGVSNRTVMTLASSVLARTPHIVAEKCLYRTKTHFGRHGDALALTGSPFKRPILLAQSAAIVTFDTPFTGTFLGRGISGISLAHPETVHQGFAPVVAIPDIF